jgi:hypothetical protein
MSLPPPTPASGWYEDPTNPGHRRWWDGVAWGKPAVSWEGTTACPNCGAPPPAEGAIACTFCAMPVQRAHPTGDRKTIVTCPRCHLSEKVPFAKQWACTQCAAQLFWGTCVGCEAQSQVWLPDAAWRCPECQRWNWSTWSCWMVCVGCQKKQLVPGFPRIHECINFQCGANLKRLTCHSCNSPNVVWGPSRAGASGVVAYVALAAGRRHRYLNRGKWKCSGCEATNSLVV